MIEDEVSRDQLEQTHDAPKRELVGDLRTLVAQSALGEKRSGPTSQQLCSMQGALRNSRACNRRLLLVAGSVSVTRGKNGLRFSVRKRKGLG